jgi:hypothetical protein
MKLLRRDARWTSERPRCREGQAETISFSSEAIERWSKWALAEADRIDPVKTARFLAD